MPINWNIASGTNAYEGALATGLKVGTMAREANERRELRTALAAAASNPDDPQAIGAVFQRSPELGLKLYDKADERVFKSALGDYVAQSGFAGSSLVETPEQRQQSQSLEARFPQAAGRVPADARPEPTRSALGSVAGANKRGAPTNALSALVPGGVGSNFDQAFASPASAAAPQPASPPVPEQSQAPGPDLAFLGEPKNGRDQAFLKMLQRDPEKALKIQSTLRDNFVKRLDGEHKFYSIAVEELGRVTDEGGWQQALGRLQPLAASMDVDLGQSVPLNYPGPQAVQQLMERALPIKDRLDYLMRGSNMKADNDRADRNADSMIANREGRLSQQRQYNEERLETTRRGQNLTDTRVRRGQELTDKRARDRPPSAGGRKSANAGSAGSPVSVTTPAEATALKPGTYYRTPDGRVKIR